MDIPAAVKALNLPAGAFAVFGSGPMAVRGLRTIDEIHVIVPENLFKQLEKDPSWKQGVLADHHKSLQMGNVNIYESWAPGSWDMSELIRNADTINGVPYVQLESVREWKELRGLPKDEEDIKLIDRYLASKTK